MQETAINPADIELTSQPQEPIVLTPGITSKKETPTKSAFATLGVLLAGWFFGNLILLAFASVGVAIAAGSTGLVKVPLVSERFFGQAESSTVTADQDALENAEEKLQTISSLASGQTLKSVALDEDEINALLQKQVGQSSSFPIVDPRIKLGENEFSLTGHLTDTNAPVEIKGAVDISGLVANVEIVSAKFGKVEIPSFIATNLVEDYLAQIGLSLSGTQLPAKSIKISDGILSLIEVSKN